MHQNILYTVAKYYIVYHFVLFEEVFFCTSTLTISLYILNFSLGLWSLVTLPLNNIIIMFIFREKGDLFLFNEVSQETKRNTHCCPS